MSNYDNKYNQSVSQGGSCSNSGIKESACGTGVSNKKDDDFEVTAKNSGKSSEKSPGDFPGNDFARKSSNQ